MNLDELSALIDDLLVHPSQVGAIEMLRQRRQAADALTALRAEVLALRQALDLLDLMYTKYEDGAPCYEDPEELAGYLGHAIKLGAEEDRILDLLNKHRPRAALAGGEHECFICNPVHGNQGNRCALHGGKHGK